MQPSGIKLHNGYELKYVAASGALGNDGRGWWHERLIAFLLWMFFLFLPKRLFEPALFVAFTKTVTYFPRAGNYRWWKPWDTLRFLPGFLVCGGGVNAYGLRNKGFFRALHRIFKRISPKRPLAVSIYPENADQLAEMLHCLNYCDNIVAVELNVSCPNTDDDITANVQKIIEYCGIARDVSRHPIILKLSVAHRPALDKIIPAVMGKVAAIAINSVPWRIFAPDQLSPLAHHGGGGVSGMLAQRFTWTMAMDIQTRWPDMPVIWPSVWTKEDAIKLITKYHAPAISFGFLLVRHPTEPTRIVRELTEMT